MQFTKVHQDLAKPVYEAIPKIAEKAGKKWKWQPEMRELFGLPDFEYNKDNLGIYLYTSKNMTYYYSVLKKKIVMTQIDYFEYCIPFLHYEKLVRILESMGYTVKLRDEDEFGKDCRYNCGIYTDKLGVGRSASTWQEAVQKAILALVEKLEARKELWRGCPTRTTGSCSGK